MDCIEWLNDSLKCLYPPSDSFNVTSAFGEQSREEAAESSAMDVSEEIYTIFGKKQKRFIITMASLGAFFSPISGNIYYPALNSLATSVHVSESLINLTITSYMVPEYLSDCLFQYTDDKHIFSKASRHSLSLGLQTAPVDVQLTWCVSSSILLPTLH